MVTAIMNPAALRGGKTTPRWASRNDGKLSARDPERVFVDVMADDGQDSTPESFDAIVARYHVKVYNICYRYMLNPEEAEDLTQDTFLRAHQSFANFRGESQVFTWLYRIAINLCHNRTKQLKRRKRMEQESLDDPVGDEGEEQQREIPDLSMSPERVAESKELSRFLQRSIRALPPDYKDVIILREFQGLSYEEIAETLGCSLEAVKSRLFRARACLKDKLAPYLYGEERTKRSRNDGR